MRLFRKSAPEFVEYPQIPLEPYERVYPRDYTPEPTPPDLLEAVERAKEWNRSDWQRLREPIPVIPPVTSLTLPWTRETPEREGVYWHVPAIDVGVMHLLVVVRYGQHLCVKSRRANSDSITYLGIARIGGWFCGPIQTPYGVPLHEIDVS